MLHDFLFDHRAEIIARARCRVQQRLGIDSLPAELDHGVPLFLTQLADALGAGHAASALGRADNGRSGGSVLRKPINDSAAMHGHELLRNGFTIQQVVHGYGDVCQIVTELASEQDASISVDEFHFFNQCLDGAIAGAVEAYGEQRDREMVLEGTERIGVLAHELRNLLNTAVLSFDAIRRGGVGANGTTGRIHLRSLAGLRNLAERALAEVRLNANEPRLTRLNLAEFLADLQLGAMLDAELYGMQLTILPCSPDVEVDADNQLLTSALSNLLQNAFKYSKRGGQVELSVRATGTRVMIDVHDDCAGLPPAKVASLFAPFVRGDVKRAGLGLGLSIAQSALRLHGGSLSAENHPQYGCVFTADLPRREGK